MSFSALRHEDQTICYFAAVAQEQAFSDYQPVLARMSEGVDFSDADRRQYSDPSHPNSRRSTIGGSARWRAEDGQSGKRKINRQRRVVRGAVRHYTIEIAHGEGPIRCEAVAHSGTPGARNERFHEEPVQLVSTHHPLKSRFITKVGSKPLRARWLLLAKLAPSPYREDSSRYPRENQTRRDQ